MDKPRVRSSDLLFFLGRGRNLSNHPLTADVRTRLAQAVDWPCVASWEAAYGCVLNEQGMTLWAAVVAVQGGSKTRAIGNPLRGGRWVNLPTPREVAAGVRFATS